MSEDTEHRIAVYWTEPGVSIDITVTRNKPFGTPPMAMLNALKAIAYSVQQEEGNR